MISVYEKFELPSQLAAAHQIVIACIQLGIRALIKA